MKKALQIDEVNARKLYPTASKDFKTMLEDSFSKEFFSQKITDRVKTFTDACEVLGIDPHSFYTATVDDNLKKDLKSINAYAKLIIIARALNEGWEPDWSNSNEYKYYPWFKMKPGFGFSGTNYVVWYSLTSVGSRLCFKSSELAEYAGKQFENIYNDYLTL